MSKRVRITNDSLNSYGTRVLTSGMNVEQYCRNPVLLYQHVRGNVIGYVKDLKVEGNEVSGELMFDEASELSQRCKKQYEFGSLRMVSVGIDILEMSDEKEHLVQGQTRPTVTKSKLFEVSLVDIGANDDAIVLTKDGKTITLGKDGECPLPKLNNNKQKPEEMDIKTLALQLGMPETATEEEVTAKLAELQAAKDENGRLAEQLKTAEESNTALVLAGITAMVDTAISEKKINADMKEHFVELGKKVGAETLKTTLEAMAPQVKLSQVIENGKQEMSAEGAWNKRMEEIRQMNLKK